MEKFSGRSVHKRRSKEERQRALIRAVESTGVGYTPAALRLRKGDFPDTPTRRVCRGSFSGARGGFGFVTPDDGYEKDIFIPGENTGGAIDGDLVEISYRVISDRNGGEKTEGRVMKIIATGRDFVIGTLVREESFMRGRHRVPARLVVLPDEASISFPIEVSDSCGAALGDKVAVKIKRGRGGEAPSGEIFATLGDAESKEANYEAILLDCGIETEFSDEELYEAGRVANLPISADGRLDLREELVLTIDGEDAKDLDDAVSLRRVKGGWRLSVHIADVSYYVKEKTPLDRAVMRRGSSVYFTDKVVPMLPPSLSNGACSLNSGEDKYALSAIINLDESGAIKSLKLAPTLIRSRVRGVYSEVNSLFEGCATPDVKKKYAAVLPMLLRMRELYLVLSERSRRRGALDMEIAEAKILLDSEGNPVDIIPRERGDGEKMIEQFMLTANEAVALELSGRGIPLVYRVHESPSEEKLSDFLVYAKNLGLDTREASKNPGAGALSALLSEAEERGIAAPVSYAMLRSMAKAKYSAERHPHFGLGLDYYCHFTSPIRRLSDLATHRIIRRVIFEGKAAPLYSSYATRAAAAATEGELRALSAERRISDLYRVLYMSKMVGEKFSAAVSSVTGFGLFVRLDNTCEGLIPMSTLPGMFVYDEGNLVIRAGSLRLRAGDRVEVRLEEADISSGKLRFSLLL